ncbi:MAG: exo-alpha-sialidase [Planctomycetes bacterium]|nr:exo-alpha-sialidase [Planctomycetota bacterium]
MTWTGTLALRIASSIGRCWLAFFAPALLAAFAAPAAAQSIELDAATRSRCVDVLRQGLAGSDFWPAIHAAEGLTLGGHADEVRRVLGPRLAATRDDQERCGIARELVRAGDRRHVAVLLAVLAGEDDYGHVHAAESLYKVVEIGDGRALRNAFERPTNLRLKLMTAGALGRCGNRRAMTFLRAMLDHEDPEQYRIAAWILGRIGDDGDIARLKRNLKRAPDELTRAYVEHSLAALGDADGLKALLRNLASDDAAVRTYAATFAGDARAIGAAGALRAMLDDPHLDARIRAAQSLLVLAAPPPPDPQEDVSRLVFRATQEHPRYTEGSVIELNGGSLVLAVTEFQGSGSDFAKARIVARRSTDGGRTWGEPRVLQENSGGLNVMSVTLRRLAAPAADGTIAMFYLEKNSFSDLDLLVRFSSDELATFSPPLRITADPGYHVVNNDRVTQLSSGRLIVPAASTADVKTENHFVSHCYLSDDGGRTWRKGKGVVDAARRGAMEPEVVELTDGRLLMIVRTQLGTIGRSYSQDGGETWSDLESLGVQSPEAPATLRRIPATGDLLLIWNNTYVPGAGHGGPRTPLTAALSADEGDSWRIVDDLEADPKRTFSYTSLTFVGHRAVMSYWESDPATNRLSTRFRSLPVAWFYR